MRTHRFGRAAAAAALLALLAATAVLAVTPHHRTTSRDAHRQAVAAVARREAAARARTTHVEHKVAAEPQAVVPLVAFREDAGGAPAAVQQKPAGAGLTITSGSSSGDASDASSGSSGNSSDSAGDRTEREVDALLESDQDDGEDNDGSGSSSSSSSSSSGASNDTASSGDDDQGPPYSCRAGHGCPSNMTHGVCCKGGDFCCEELCLDDELPLRCGTTQGQLRAAREAYAENLRQSHLDEELTKKAMEMTLYKRRLEMEARTEQVQKSKLTQREEARKREITAQEEKDKKEIRATSEARQKLVTSAANEQSHKQLSTRLRLSDSVRDFGGDYRLATFRRAGPICVLSGRVRIAGTFEGEVARLPASCRPRSRLVFDLHVFDTHTARVDVSPTGLVVLKSAPMRELDWLALDGVSFFVEGAPEQDLELLRGWHHRPGGDAGEGITDGATGIDKQYQNGGYNTFKGLCALTGMVQVRGTDKMKDMPFVAQLPPACRPARHSVFSSNNHDRTHRVDVFGPTDNGDPGGRIFWNGGEQRKQWISLDGAMLLTPEAVKGQQVLQPVEGFKTVGDPYNKLGATLVDDVLVVLSGVVSSTKAGAGLITVLPENTRPSKRLVFGAQKPMHRRGSDSVRVDVFPNGEVWWIQSPSGSTGQPDPSVQDSNFRPGGSMIALDGIHFTVP